MARTNIDIDNQLVGEVMRRFNCRTKKDAVDFALRRLVGPVMTRDEMRALKGIGWDADLDELRGDSVDQL
ncbi:type II toxin-antitoxin system VapB family antitoxin [Nocardioides salsibiostraticola]